MTLGHPLLRIILVCIVCIEVPPGALAGEDPIEKDPLELALERFWAARGDAQVGEAIEKVLAVDPDFEELLTRLRRGRRYIADVPRGKIITKRRFAGHDHPCMIFIPEQYDPARSWPVRWDLHGGMGQPEWKKLDGSWSPGYAAIERYTNDLITVVPAGWWDSMWWEGSQADNFREILDDLKRTYNVDEDRVVMIGSSDGAIAEWFYAFRDPDAWAHYVGFVGFPARLTNPALRPDGQMHLSNLAGQRFLLHNGVKDRIVNIGVTRKYLKRLRAVEGVEIEAHEHETDGHELNLTREEEVHSIIEPLRHSRRDPLPDRLSWATERTDRYHRRSWLVIEELDPDAPIDRTNILPRITGRNVPRVDPLEPKPWGRVALEREGNTVRATTTAVRRFRLLLSPDEFDLTEPVRVMVDGRTAFEGTVPPDRRTLLTWAARDNDRRKLFAAELEIVVSERPGG